MLARASISLVYMRIQIYLHSYTSCRLFCRRGPAAGRMGQSARGGETVGL